MKPGEIRIAVAKAMNDEALEIVAQRLTNLAWEVLAIRDTHPSRKTHVLDSARIFLRQVRDAERASSQQDKERLDWLLKPAGNQTLGVVEVESVKGRATWHFTREAIDAAMSATKEKL